MCDECHYKKRVREIKDLAVSIYDTTMDIEQVEQVLRILRDVEECRHVGERQWRAYKDLAQAHAWTLSAGGRFGN